MPDEIDKNKTQLNDSLIQMGKFVSEVLDAIEISEDELDAAAKQLELMQRVKIFNIYKEELKTRVEGSCGINTDRIIRRLDN